MNFDRLEEINYEFLYRLNKHLLWLEIACFIGEEHWSRVGIMRSMGTRPINTSSKFYEQQEKKERKEEFCSKLFSADNDTSSQIVLGLIF